MSFKKLWSYFRDIPLEETSSDYNPYIEVLLVQGRHQLITKDAVYSFDDKYDNFHACFKAINWDKFECKKVLVLGLGLASVIFILERSLKKSFNYVAVEIDPVIAQLAQKYTLNQLDAHVEVITTDAANYVGQSSETFDLILMDVFQSARIPMKFQSESFLTNTKSMLNQGGLMIYNRMNHDEASQHENDIFNELFRQVYPKSGVFEIKENLLSVSNVSYLKNLKA